MLFVLIDAALACGGFAPTDGSLVSSDSQQALFDLGAETITVTYRAVYEGNAADFAWVIAVPGVISSVAEGDAEQLERLAEVSAPEVVVDPAVSDAEVGCGCGGSKSDALSGGRGWEGDTGGAVTVTGSGFAGDFSYTTLAASDAASLTTWLDENGYDTSYVAGAIEAYVADPIGYEFVAVQLRPDAADTEDGGVRLDPLAITYGPAGDGALHAVYPAMLARSATVDSLRTEIYVLASGLATVGGGWTGVDNPATTEESPGDIVGPDYENPDGLYAAHVSALGGEQRQMWLAWAGELDGRWLTRWDAIVAPATNVTDPIFTNSGDEVSADTVIYLQEESAYEAEHPSGAILWLLPMGLAAGVGLRRRR
jgi:hypothetical protein